MICEELAAERCPCLLAETSECSYCTLLREETVCDCDWQGQCAYDRYQWRDRATTAWPAGTVVAVRPFSAATGLVVKGDGDLTAAPAGSLVKICLPFPGGREIVAAVLRIYPSGLVYMLSFDPCPGDLLIGRTLAPTIVGNAFSGYQTLAAARSQSVVIAAEARLTELLRPLADDLRHRGNRVSFATPDDLAAVADAEVVFAAGRENEIKRMAVGLPPSFLGKIVTWLIGE